MDISIIIPTYNKENRLDITLQSLVNDYKKSKKEHNIELIVVDDGSTDLTNKIVNKYKKDINLKYILKENGGLSRARNRGIIESKYDILLFLDDDRVICNSYFDNLFLGENDIVIGKRKEWYIRNFEKNYSKIIQMVNHDIEYIESITYDSRYYSKTKMLYINNQSKISWVGCTFANTLIKKEVFEKIGYFSIDFKGWGFEDIDVAYRAYKYGFKIGLNKSMVTYHLFHQHGKEILKQRDENYKVFYKRNPDYPVRVYENFYKNIINVKEFEYKVDKYYEDRK